VREKAKEVMGLFKKKVPQPAEPPAAPEPEPLTVKEQVREQKRNIDKSIRELDRERMRMEQQEKQLQGQIKKAAKEGHVDAARMIAKDLVRTRKQTQKMYQMRTQLQSVSMQMTSIQSTAAMSQAMAGVVGAMSTMNKQMDLPSMQKIVMEYERENGKMEMTQEMMDDAMDSVMAGDGEEAETDEVINKVFDELGLETGARFGAGGIGAGAPLGQTSANANEADAELDERLAKLTR